MVQMVHLGKNCPNGALREPFRTPFGSPPGTRLGPFGGSLLDPFWIPFGMPFGGGGKTPIWPSPRAGLAGPGAGFKNLFRLKYFIKILMKDFIKKLGLGREAKSLSRT